jgi:hypothetical protein
MSTACKTQGEEITRAACEEFKAAYFKYLGEGLRLRPAVYSWNNFTTKVIFAIVHFIVLLGLYFSFLHFRGSLKPGKVVESTEVELAIQGLKVKSPVLGVVILTVSLAFFYLYLIYVYPVRERF